MGQCAADVNLRGNLDREGLEVQSVPRDNNCQFHALARQLEQVQPAAYLRELAYLLRLRMANRAGTPFHFEAQL